MTKHGSPNASKVFTRCEIGKHTQNRITLYIWTDRHKKRCRPSSLYVLFATRITVYRPTRINRYTFALVEILEKYGREVRCLKIYSKGGIHIK